MPTSACDHLDIALANVARTEHDVRAWVHLDERGARKAVKGVADDMLLAGAILGVKDIFDVTGMPTRCGLEIDDLSSGNDATAVARLRAAGAVVLGKTRTTPFAWLDPAPTRNPHDLERTPGGSSAGSAAAVAAGHCTIALGSQTVASTLRPASFCGVVGFKPSFDRVPTQGITPLAKSLDHVGIFARTVAEVRATISVLDPTLRSDAQEPAMRAFIDDLTLDPSADADSGAALGSAAMALRTAGYAIEVGPLPAAVARANELVTTVLAYESFAAHGERWNELGAALPLGLAELLQLGRATSVTAYESALAERESLREQIAEFLISAGTLVTPCAIGAAPPRDTTGDGRYVRPWTFFGVPSIAVPIRRDGNAMPIGVQLVAAMRCDATLLRTASVLETRTGTRT